MEYGLPPDLSKEAIFYIPDPRPDLSVQGIAIYYRLAQWLMDREGLSTGNVYYVNVFADTIDLWQQCNGDWHQERREKELDFMWRHGEIFNFATRDYKAFNIPPPPEGLDLFKKNDP